MVGALFRGTAETAPDRTTVGAVDASDIGEVAVEEVPEDEPEPPPVGEITPLPIPPGGEVGETGPPLPVVVGSVRGWGAAGEVWV